MLYRENPMRPGAIWVDRGIDDKVEDFEPCEPCAEYLRPLTQLGDRWQDLTLCDECFAELEVQSAIDEIKGQRLYNLDREPETIAIGQCEGLDFLFDTPDRYYREDEWRNF
jgi:hypothetical protein